MPADAESAREQLRHLVEAHQAGTWRYLRYLGADNSEADDLTQETFLSVARTGFGEIDGQFEQRSEAQTAAYLRTAARNQLLMLRRRQKRQVGVVDLEAAETVWARATEDHHWESLIDSLTDCVGQLEGRSREAIDLQYHEGASRAQIAKQLEMKPDGVKTLLRRTRQLLRECIQRKQSQEQP